MKDAYEVLYQKEAELVRVRKEIESLTLSAQLLADDEVSFFAPVAVPDGQGRKPAQTAAAPEATGTDGQPLVRPRLGFWSGFKIRR